MPEKNCATCGRPGPVELEMKAKTGQLLTMLSCTRCENRTWLVDGAPVAFEDVLKVTNGDPSFTVQRSVKPPRGTTRR